jgi:hypothetical protein
LFSATLKEIGLAIQRGRQSYPLQIRADLPTTSSDIKIFPGMTAMVQIDLIRPNRPLKIPIAALIDDGNAAAVWRVQDNQIIRHPVKILRLIGAEAEIESDLQPHEKIVTAGTKSLHEGQTVRILLSSRQKMSNGNSSRER